jgi:hypothetical protein
MSSVANPRTKLMTFTSGGIGFRAFQDVAYRATAAPASQERKSWRAVD